MATLATLAATAQDQLALLCGRRVTWKERRCLHGCVPACMCRWQAKQDQACSLVQWRLVFSISCFTRVHPINLNLVSLYRSSCLYLQALLLPFV